MNVLPGTNVISFPGPISGEPVDINSVFNDPNIDLVATYDVMDPNGPWLVARRERSVTINLAELNESGQSGTATLIDRGSQTEVIVELSEGPAGPDVAQPIHIHSGSCDNLGQVVFPLNNLVGGASTTVVDVSLDDLLAGDYAINAHKSADEVSEFTACGDIAGTPTSKLSGNLTTVDSLHAYWVISRSSLTLSVSIPKYPTTDVGTLQPPQIVLVKGWNLVPVIDTQVRSVDQAPVGIPAATYFASLGGNATSVLTWDTIRFRWVKILTLGVDPGDNANALDSDGNGVDDEVLVGQGYWVFVTTGSTLVP